MLTGNLIIWSKYRWNIEKVHEFNFLNEKLRNLQAGGVKT